jgi:membrane protein
MEVKRPLRAFDRLQRRHPVLAVPVATVLRFGEDRGSDLAATIAFRAFFSLFPLLLLFTSLLGYVLAGDEQLRHEAVSSVLSQLPVIGEQIQVGSLNGSGIALAIGAVGSLWAGFGVVLATEAALDAVWEVPDRERPGFLASRLRALILLATLGTLMLASTILSGLAGGGAGLLGSLGGVAVSLMVNLLLFGAVFSLLGSRPDSISTVLPGVALAALGWTVLQLVGGLFVSHEVRGATPAYGTFALVLGLLVWINLGAMLTVLSAELNVVLERDLWPRRLPGASG